MFRHRIRVTCPECIEAAKGYLLKTGQSADHLEIKKEFRDESIIARDTSVSLNEPYRQKHSFSKRVAVWKKNHNLSLTELDSLSGLDTTPPTIYHVGISNDEHSSAPTIRLCKHSDLFTLSGPGAAQQIADDAEKVAARDQAEHHAEVEKARKTATGKEVGAHCKALEAAFRGLGIKARAHAGLTSEYASTILLDAKDAVTVLTALGAVATPLPRDPMPIWSVRYGDDDKEPLLLGARTEAGVRVHMLEHYCDERREDEPNVPLDPSKLRIERIDD